MTGTVSSVSDSSAVSHLCQFCLNGDASLYASANVSAKYKKGSDNWKTLYSKNLGTATKHIKTFYCSKRSNGWHYGNGTCTNKSYLATFTVKSSNKALSGVTVYDGSTKLGTTNSKGVYSKKLTNGTHTIKFKKSGYTTKSLSVTISSGTVSKNVSMSKKNGANETYYTIDDLIELTDEEFNDFISDSYNMANTIFRIETAEDLAKLSDFVNNSGKTTEGLRFVLNNADGTIDLSNSTWTPIGTQAAPFKGEFDGNKFTLKGLIVSGDNNYSGLFGCIDNAKIFDLGIENASVSGGNHIGILAGAVINASDIYDCYTTGVVSGNNNVGGVIGSISQSNLINSYNTAAVAGTNNVGGLVGTMEYSSRKGQISNGYNAGKITANSNLGGIAGQIIFDESSDSTSANDEEVVIDGVQYCYFVDSTADNAVGVSSNAKTIIAYPVSESQAIGSADEIISDTEGYAFTYSLLDALNGWYEVFGQNSSVDSSEETSDEDGAIVTAADNYNKWYADEAMANSGYPVFEAKGKTYKLTVDYVYEDGAEAKPSVILYLEGGQNYDVDSYTIPGYYTVDIEYSGVMPESDLDYRVIYYKETEYADSVSNLYDNYLQSGTEAVNEKIYSVENANDLQALSNYTNAGGSTSGIIFKQTSAIDMNGVTIDPIGNEAAPFKGTYNGQGIEISNLAMNKNNDYCGLFGYVDGANLESINLSQSTVSGNDYTGAIAGYAANSKINYCYNVSTSVTGNNYVGGAIGYAEKTDIDRTENTGSVTGNNYVGGVCGKGVQVGITNSYNTSGIEGNNYIGGISGMSENVSIANSYNNGAIGLSASSYVGGIAGSVNNTEIINNYSSGLVSGQNNTNPIVGTNANVASNYYLTTDADTESVVENLNSWVKNECTEQYNVWLMDEESKYPIFGVGYEGWLNNLNINKSTISFEYDSDSHYEAIFYVAQYNENGQLLSCKIISSNGQTSIPTDNDSAMVKFMLWDEDMTALETVVTQSVK